MTVAAFVCATLALLVALGGLIAWALCGANDFPEDRR